MVGSCGPSPDCISYSARRPIMRASPGGFRDVMMMRCDGTGRFPEIKIKIKIK